MDNKIMIDEQTVVSWMVVVILTDCTKRLKPKKNVKLQRKPCNRYVTELFQNVQQTGGGMTELQ
jgi:hypothetical protein